MRRRPLSVGRLFPRLVPACLVLVVAVSVVAVSAAVPAGASPPSNDPAAASTYSASWLAQQVNAQGFVPQAADPTQPNLSTSAQAVIALAAAGVGRSQVDALETYLGSHVDDFVVKGGNDDPGSLAYLILGAVAAGRSPTDFGSGHADLVARLQATKQPNGLFGASDPSFDGAFRQGLALMALHIAGVSDASAADWLEGQQCADGLWTAFRSDTTQPCAPVDPATFTGPDTNSSALAVLGLQAQGRSTPATTGADALKAVRNSGGGWGFLARSDQATDANSTGLVVTALRSATGSVDAQGANAILALQVGCDGAAGDVGGIAFQPDSSGALVPDALATAQATPALAGVVVPMGSATISDNLVSCAPAATTTSTTTSTTTVTPASETVTPGGAVAGAPLARTGSPALAEMAAALMLLGAGVVLVQLAHDRRRT